MTIKTSTWGFELTATLTLLDALFLRDLCPFLFSEATDIIIFLHNFILNYDWWRLFSVQLQIYSYL